MKKAFKHSQTSRSFASKTPSSLSKGPSLAVPFQSSTQALPPSPSSAHVPAIWTTFNTHDNQSVDSGPEKVDRLDKPLSPVRLNSIKILSVLARQSDSSLSPSLMHSRPSQNTLPSPSNPAFVSLAKLKERGHSLTQLHSSEIGTTSLPRTLSATNFVTVGGKPICPLNSWAIIPTHVQKKYIPHPRRSPPRTFSPTLTHTSMPHRIFSLSSYPQPSPSRTKAETPPLAPTISQIKTSLPKRKESSAVKWASCSPPSGSGAASPSPFGLYSPSSSITPSGSSALKQPQMAALHSQYSAFLAHKNEREALKRRQVAASLNPPKLVKFEPKTHIPVPTVALTKANSKHIIKVGKVGSTLADRASRPSDSTLLSPLSVQAESTPQAGDISPITYVEEAEEEQRQPKKEQPQSTSSEEKNKYFPSFLNSLHWQTNRKLQRAFLKNQSGKEKKVIKRLQSQSSPLSPRKNESNSFKSLNQNADLKRRSSLDRLILERECQLAQEAAKKVDTLPGNRMIELARARQDLPQYSIEPKGLRGELKVERGHRMAKLKVLVSNDTSLIRRKQDEWQPPWLASPKLIKEERDASPEGKVIRGRDLERSIEFRNRSRGEVLRALDGSTSLYIPGVSLEEGELTTNQQRGASILGGAKLSTQSNLSISSCSKIEGLAIHSQAAIHRAPSASPKAPR